MTLNPSKRTLILVTYSFGNIAEALRHTTGDQDSRTLDKLFYVCLVLVPDKPFVWSSASLGEKQPLFSSLPGFLGDVQCTSRSSLSRVVCFPRMSVALCWELSDAVTFPTSSSGHRTLSPPLFPQGIWETLGQVCRKGGKHTGVCCG